MGDGYDANAWSGSFSEVAGLDMQRLPLELPKTTDPRGQRESCSDLSLERRAGLREALKVKAAYMFYSGTPPVKATAWNSWKLANLCKVISA